MSLAPIQIAIANPITVRDRQRQKYVTTAIVPYFSNSAVQPLLECRLGRRRRIDRGSRGDLGLAHRGFVPRASDASASSSGTEQLGVAGVALRAVGLREAIVERVVEDGVDTVVVPTVRVAIHRHRVELARHLVGGFARDGADVVPRGDAPQVPPAAARDVVVAPVVRRVVTAHRNANARRAPTMCAGR